MTDFLRTTLYSISRMLFNFSDMLFDFLGQLAEQSNLIITQTNISSYINKMYVFVGIVMLFRLGIVLIQYIANPDKVMNPKEGVGPRVIPHVMTVLVLLVATPIIFDLLYNLQNLVLKSNFITNFFASENIFGASGESGSSDLEEAQAAQMKYLTDDNPLFDEDWPRKNLYDTESEKVDFVRKLLNGEITETGMKLYVEDFFDVDPEQVSYYRQIKGISCIGCRDKYGNVYPLVEEFKITSPGVKSEFAGIMISDVLFTAFYYPRVPENQIDSNVLNTYKTEIIKINDPKADPVDYEELEGILNDEGSYGYSFEFNGFTALIISFVVIALLVATVFRVSLRIFKLITLEIIAPIPIIMYADPSVRKKGETPLEKWVKELIKTYIDLFVRLFVISFIAFMISDMFKFLENDSSGGLILKLFIIIGGLMFMDIAPTFLGNILGFTPEPGSFNPIKQMQKVPVFGEGMAGVTLGAGIGAAGAAVGFVSGGLRTIASGGNFGELGRAIQANTTIGARAGMYFGTHPGTRNPVSQLRNIRRTYYGNDNIPGSLHELSRTSHEQRVAAAATERMDNLHTEALQEDAVRTAHTEALRENQQIDNQRSATQAYSDYGMQGLHEQAIKENYKRDLSSNSSNQYQQAAGNRQREIQAQAASARREASAQAAGHRDYAQQQSRENQLHEHGMIGTHEQAIKENERRG